MAGSNNNEAAEGARVVAEMVEPIIKMLDEEYDIISNEIRKTSQNLTNLFRQLMQKGTEFVASEIERRLSANDCKMQQDLNVLEDYGRTDLAREISAGYDALQSQIRTMAANPSQLNFDKIDEVAERMASLQQMQIELRNDNTEFMKSMDPKIYDRTREKMDKILRESPLQRSLNRVNNGLAAATPKPGSLDARFESAKKEAKLFNASRPAEMIQKGIQQAAQSMDRVLAR